MTHKVCKIKLTVKQIKKVILFEFNTSENLIFFAQSFIKICEKLNINSDLYVLKNKYRILLKTENRSVIQKLSPLADRVTSAPTEIAITLEHARLITANYAINKIGKAFIGL